MAAKGGLALGEDERRPIRPAVHDDEHGRVGLAGRVEHAGFLDAQEPLAQVLRDQLRTATLK
jgi:hypothetical protein